MSTYKIDIPAGPIFSDEDAKHIAPKIAAAHQGTWDGNWTTVVQNEMSVVKVELNVKNTGKYEYLTNVLAGPLMSDAEAQKYGPAIAASYGAEFTGKWTTIQMGVMSIIEIRYRF